MSTPRGASMWATACRLMAPGAVRTSGERMASSCNMATGSTVAVVGVLIHAARAAQGSGTVAGCAAGIVRTSGNRMGSRSATVGGRTTSRRCNVDTGVAAGTGVLSSRARPIAGRILCDTRSVAVLRQVGRTALNARNTVACHSAVGGHLAGVRAFGEAAGCLIIIADAGATAIVVVGVATDCARTTLTDRSSVWIRRACLALQATGGGIVVGRKRIATLVIPGTASERAGSS